MVENNNPHQSMGNRRISRRSTLKGLTTIAGLASVAGCVGGGGGSGRNSSNGGPIKIGLQADLTGALSIYGFWHRRVLENYVEQLNSNDGIGGRNVELLVKNTETDAEVGARAFRNLVQQNQVDFVIGSQSSGVSIATTPLAKQFKVPYFPLGEAPSITGDDGNRWIVRNNHSTKHAAEIAVQHGMNIGSKWTIIYQNYSFGKQYRDAVQEGVKQRGGEVLNSIGVPIGESDLTPYLNKVPNGTGVLFNALIGSSAVNFLQQSSNLNTPGSRLGAIASIEGLDIQGLSKDANGAEYVTMLPRRPSETDGNLAEYLKQIADASKTDNVYLGGHISASYEALSWINDAVVASEWSGDDDQAFIKWFEGGPSVEASKKYPQGKMFFRGTDHQGFMDMYIEQIDSNQLNKVKQINVDEPTFEPRADLESQEF